MQDENKKIESTELESMGEPTVETPSGIESTELESMDEPTVETPTTTMLKEMGRSSDVTQRLEAAKNFMIDDETLCLLAKDHVYEVRRAAIATALTRDE